MNLAHVVGAALAVIVLVPDAAAGMWFSVAVVFLCIFLAVTLLQQHVTFIPTGVVLVFGYYFVMAVSTISQQRTEELLPLVRAGLPVILLALAASAVPRSDRGIVLRWITVLALFEAAVAISQHLLGWPTAWGWLGNRSTATSIGYNPITGDFGRSAGTMGHGIPLALLLATGIILLWPKLRARNFQLPAAGIAVLSYAMVLTGSRSAIICLCATALIMTLTRLRNPRAWTAIGIVGIATFLLVDLRTLTIFTSLDGSISLTHRISAFEALSNLIGLGFFNTIAGNGWGANESLGTIGVLQSQRILAIDNGFVSLVATSGIIGAILVVALVMVGIWKTHGVERAILILSLGMFLSFDVPVWTASFAPVVVLCCLSAGARAREAVGNEQGPGEVQLVPNLETRLRTRA